MANCIVVFKDPLTGARLWAACKNDSSAWKLYDRLAPHGYNPVIYFAQDGMTSSELKGMPNDKKPKN